MAARIARLVAMGTLLAVAGCSVRQIPLTPDLSTELDEDSPRATGQVVALVMDPAVQDFRRERTFSLTQEERYDSGEHFMRSLLAQLRARGFTVLEVESREQGNALGARYVLVPDAPGVSVIRPKGLLDFSALGSLNRISVSYSVRLYKDAGKIPERLDGSGSRTASFFWSNAALQTIGLGLIGLSVSFVIYGLWIGTTLAQILQNNPNIDSLREAAQTAVPPQVAITVFVADILVSQITAQVVPRVINPLVDVFINEPRWESMVQSAHDEAIEDLADTLARKLGPTPAGVTP